MTLFGLIVILIGCIAYYAFYVTRNFNAEMLPALNLVIPVLMLIFTYLAFRGIRKDDRLIKSYDRLR